MSNTKTDDQPTVSFQEFISVRLHMLVSVNERAATLLYARKFGINLVEWRVMAVLGGSDSLSVVQVAKLADLDKSRASRTAAALVKRRYVSRKANKEDSRMVVLSLTPSGLALYEQICLEEGRRRQERLLSCLTKTERVYLDRAVDKLIAQARLMYKEEWLINPRPAKR